MQLPASSIIEVFQNGYWVPAAELRMLDAEKCRFEYLADYIFGAAHPAPISHRLPVRFFPQRQHDLGAGLEDDLTPPSFIYDLVSQGRGRRFLVEHLNIADNDALVLPLVMAGAFNPIGNLRFASAVGYYDSVIEQMGGKIGAEIGGKAAQALQGFTLDDIVQRGEAYLEHIGVFSMLAAGTTGVQGVAPKYLLTTDQEGLWYADLALDDAKAKEHWLLKLPRGRSDADRAVLRNEAAYLRVAQHCGLRVQAGAMLVGELLFVRRFDRHVDQAGLSRWSQESLASVIGMTGLTKAVPQNVLLAGLRHAVDDPLTETIEFLKRDVLNLALRNTDNHARNTAVQTVSNIVSNTVGPIVGNTRRLTPLYDFAPMFMDPEVVGRTCHWVNGDGVRLDHWRDVVETLDIPQNERQALAKALYSFTETVGGLSTVALDLGVETKVLEQCQKSIERQAEQLYALRPLAED